MTLVRDLFRHGKLITPPMRSAGIVAYERFVADHPVKGCQDRDDLVCAIYSAMEDNRSRPRDRNTSRTYRRLCLQFRRLWPLFGDAIAI